MTVSTDESSVTQAAPKVVNIEIPSGKVIVSDDFRSVDAFNISAPMTEFGSLDLDGYTHELADKVNVAYAFSSNTCPSVIKDSEGNLTVAYPELDEGTDEPILNEGESVVALVCTDLWATMITDYQHWLDQGGKEVNESGKFTVVDVRPGSYKWTVYSNAIDFDFNAEGRVVYARLELVTDDGE